MSYKYVYTGSGIMTFYDSKGESHIVSSEKREVILEEKLEIAGLKLVEESGKVSKKSNKESEE